MNLGTESTRCEAQQLLDINIWHQYIEWPIENADCCYLVLKCPNFPCAGSKMEMNLNLPTVPKVRAIRLLEPKLGEYKGWGTINDDRWWHQDEDDNTSTLNVDLSRVPRSPSFSPWPACFPGTSSGCKCKSHMEELVWWKNRTKDARQCFCFKVGVPSCDHFHPYIIYHIYLISIYYCLSFWWPNLRKGAGMPWPWPPWTWQAWVWKMIPKVYQKNHEGKDMRFNMV